MIRLILQNSIFCSFLRGVIVQPFFPKIFCLLWNNLHKMKLVLIILLLGLMFFRSFSGWVERTIMYLYNSNKSRADCEPYPHTNDQAKLTLIEGHALHDLLNATTGRKFCTLVFFFAGSCPYSRRAAPLLHAAALYFPTLHFVAVNTDKYPG